jgi:hypothetical protein
LAQSPPCGGDCATLQPSGVLDQPDIDRGAGKHVGPPFVATTISCTDLTPASRGRSRRKVSVIPTNEELMIARHTGRLLGLI